METQNFTGYDTLVYSVYVSELDVYPPGIIKEHPDTNVAFIMDDEIWFNYNPLQPEKKIVLGAAVQGNRIIGVSCYGIFDYYDILKQNDYKIDIWDKYHMQELMRESCDINVSGMMCLNDYRLIGRDSLVLLRRYRHIRFMENIAEKHNKEDL